MADQEETTISKDGYEITFYPGFASRCTVRDADGAEYELYAQNGPYKLPDGQTKPKDKYRIAFKGGKKKQDVRLDVTDPALRIKRIVVELYGDDHEPGTGVDSGTADTFTLQNNTVTCPPNC